MMHKLNLRPWKRGHLKTFSAKNAVFKRVMSEFMPKQGCNTGMQGFSITSPLTSLVHFLIGPRHDVTVNCNWSTVTLSTFWCPHMPGSHRWTPADVGLQRHSMLIRAPQVPSSTLTALLTDKEALVAVLLRHVLPETIFQKVSLRHRSNRRGPWKRPHRSSTMCGGRKWQSCNMQGGSL